MNEFSGDGFLLKKDYDPKKEGKSAFEESLSQKRRKLSDTLLGPKDDTGETREIKDQEDK